jgi:fluoroquinolone transport system permease protein
VITALNTRRVLSSLRWEIKLQYRNGFYYATAFILAFWLVLYTQVPGLDLTAYLPGMLIGNLQVTTFYFMAGLVMLEKDEGSLESRVVTPMRSEEYLLVKVLALSVLVLVESLIIAALFSYTPAGGMGLQLLPAVIGLLLCSAMFSLIGFLAVVRYDSINEFLIPSMLYTLPMMLPLVDFFGLYQTPLVYLHPVQAALVLLKGAFQPISAWEWLYGLGYSTAAIAVLVWLCRRAFRQFVTVH